MEDDDVVLAESLGVDSFLTYFFSTPVTPGTGSVSLNLPNLIN